VNWLSGFSGSPKSIDANAIRKLQSSLWLTANAVSFEFATIFMSAPDRARRVSNAHPLVEE
jgi:hypothetical protein